MACMERCSDGGWLLYSLDDYESLLSVTSGA